MKVTLLSLSALVLGSPGLRASEPVPAAIVQPQQGQTVVIKGTVRDRLTNTPIAGVNVVDLETGSGTISQSDGAFLVTLRRRDRIALQFSFIGMKTVDVVWTGQPFLDVLMEEDALTMGEVVVTGIFERKAESFTGSAATYSREEIRSLGTQNVLESLKSLDPSVNITPNDLYGSDPNRLPDLDIRGKTSISDPRNEYTTDPNQPLYILDGFEAKPQDIVNLNVNRIQSLTVLKDAASTAIYGSQAANGVIVIETLRPAPGKLRVEYGASVDLNIPDLSDYNLMNAEEKLAFELASGAYNMTHPVLDHGLKELYEQRQYRVLSGVDSYWLNEPVRTGVSNRHDLYVSGGDQTVTYGIGLNYANTQGAMKNSGNDVVGGSFDLQYRVNKWRFSNKFSLTYNEKWRPGVSFSTFAQTNPYYEKPGGSSQPQFLEDFRFIEPNIQSLFVQESNPLYNNSLKSINDEQTLGFRDNLYVEWRPLDGLRVTGRFSIDASRGKTEFFKSPFHTDYEEQKTATTLRGEYRKTNIDQTQYSGDLTVAYYKLFAEKHQLNLVATAKMQATKMKTDGYKAVGFSDDLIPYPAFANQYEENGKPSYNQLESRAANFFLNAGYVYDQRYSVDFTIRQDGSSNFGRQNLFTTTWAAGVAWNIHHENFARDLFSLLKLRFTIGNPGNNSTQYFTETTYRYHTRSNLFGNGLYINQYGSDGLDWEKTLDMNAGIDFTTRDRRFSLTFDAYQKYADPLIVRLDVPLSTGRENLLTNMGRNTIKGLTFKLNYNVIQRPQENIWWAIGVNGSSKTSKFSKIGDLSQLNDELREVSNMHRYYNGGSQYDIWAVRSAGIDPGSGNEVFVKRDGSYTFTHSTDDEVAVGNTEPKLEGRIHTTFRYKGWNAGIYLHYILGAEQMNLVLQDRIEGLTRTDVLTKNQDRRAYHDRWQKPGDIAKYKRITDLDGKDNYITDRFLQKKNWLAGESISLGYDFEGHQWLRKAGIENLSVRAIFQDVFNWSTVKQERGLDYPYDRTITFSVNVTF